MTTDRQLNLIMSLLVGIQPQYLVILTGELVEILEYE